MRARLREFMIRGMRFIQILIASLLALGATGVVSAFSLVVRDVLEVEKDGDPETPSD